MTCLKPFGQARYSVNFERSLGRRGPTHLFDASSSDFARKSFNDHIVERLKI